MKLDLIRPGLRLLVCASLVAPALAGCCRQPPVAAAASSVEPIVELALPAWTDEGPGLEHQVLFEGEGMKVAAIALRGGTALPEHSADARLSIQVLRGSGVLRVGERALAVEPGSVVVLEPSLPHAVDPAGEELMVLVVHYFGAP
ncbi:AraC family ligand binding domain-containing protein [Enhygromyxa salina]|nr:AraC family ligand binding domain-containing protein [Enhygromyxa salina]